MEEPTGAFELFYSYAHKDEKLRNELEKHLVHLKRLGLIINWYDRDINAGTEWAYEIDTHLNSAQIILMLISPDFIASEYCYSIEMVRAMERHEAGDARVIPIILRPTEWRSSPFSKLQALPTNGRPVTKWPNRDEALLDVAKGIREVIKKLPPLVQKQVEFVPTSDTIPLSSVLEEGQEHDTNRAPAWNVPYRRNPLFTSREDILQHLHETFTKLTEPSSNQPLVLSGLGGMGKTQIALEYAYRHREEYHDVLWAKADSQEVLASELASFATLLNLPGQREQDQHYALDIVKRWLEVHSNWLLILDNVENLPMVHEYLPVAPKGHILLTAQTKVTGEIAQRVDIDQMAPEGGALFLLRRAHLLAADALLDHASEETRKQAIEIAKMLDGLPLAIDQAGAYIEETGTNLHRYVQFYESRRTNLLNIRGGFVPNHPESVTATMSLSFEKVENSSAVAAQILRFLAFLHPDAIPEELLEQGASQLGSLLQAEATNPLSLDKAVGELLKYSLVRRNPDGAMLTLHRLVQDVLKDSMDEPTQRQWAEQVVRAVNQVFPKVEFATWDACQLYLPHAQSCAAYIETWRFTFTEAARLLYETGRYLEELGQYPEATTLIMQSLTIREQTLGTEHLEVAESLNELADLYRKQGTYVKGDPFAKRALAIREKMLGPNHQDVSQSLDNLARLYHKNGQYSEAEPLYKRALDIIEKDFGPEHPDRLTILSNYILLLRATNRKGRAAEMEARLNVLRRKSSKRARKSVSLNVLQRMDRE
ncbi:MAG TPA: tetratricopeptide repeat protein [Ktedonobacteraceae bacterium]